MLLVLDQHFLFVFCFFKDVSFVVLPAAVNQDESLSLGVLVEGLYAVEVDI